MTILQVFSRLFGYDYERVKEQPTASRQKIVTLGTLVVIPVVLWFISSYYLSGHLLGSDTFTALIVGLTMGGIILIIDRSFIAAPKGKYGFVLLIYRLMFAGITTLLGAVALDLMVFGEDLEEYRSGKAELVFSKAKEAYIQDHLYDLEELKERIGKEEATLKKWERAYDDEMSGKGGTGIYGKGSVATAKEKQIEKSQIRIDGLWEELEMAKRHLDEEASDHAGKLSKKRKGALLSKLEDLYAFLADKPVGRGVYWIFMAMVFFLEGSFVIFKFTCSQSLYEDLLYAEEEIGKKRLQMLRDRRKKIIGEDGRLGKDAMEIRRISGERQLRKII